MVITAIHPRLESPGGPHVGREKNFVVSRSCVRSLEFSLWNSLFGCNAFIPPHRTFDVVHESCLL